MARKPPKARFGARVWVHPDGMRNRRLKGRVLSHDPYTGRMKVLSGLRVLRTEGPRTQYRDRGER